MAKFKTKKFSADTVTSREYRSAIILEEVLAERNDSNLTRYATRVLQNFNKVFKSIKTLENNRVYFSKLLIQEFEKKIMDDVGIEIFVRTLILNVIKTKYKTEILARKI